VSTLYLLAITIAGALLCGAIGFVSAKRYYRNSGGRDLRDPSRRGRKAPRSGDVPAPSSLHGLPDGSGRPIGTLGARPSPSPTCFVVGEGAAEGADEDLCGAGSIPARGQEPEPVKPPGSSRPSCSPGAASQVLAAGPSPSVAIDAATEGAAGADPTQVGS
jgi:hypothetical protein